MKLFRTFKTHWPFVSTSSSGFQALNSVVRSQQTTNSTLSNGAAFCACSTCQFWEWICLIIREYLPSCWNMIMLLHQTDTCTYSCPLSCLLCNSYRLLNNTLKISLWDFNDLFLPPLYFSLSLSFPFKCLVSFPFLPPPSWWNRAHFF